MSDDRGKPDQTSRLVLRIGEWTVERALNQLRRGNEVVRLEPKAIEVLVLLAERGGEVVSREQLLATVWPGVIVGDDALTQAIIKLRKALGDSARDASYIETIAKRGYRLIAPVARETEAGVRAADTPLFRAPPLPPVRRSRPVLTVLTISCVVAAAALLVLRDDGDASFGIGEASVLQRGISLLAAQPTIAVRPFEVLGDDPRLAVLAGGLTSDLTTDVSSVAGLTVLGGTRPVRAAEGETEALPEHYFVSGTVQRDAGRLRVNVHLTDARTGRQLWSERFERDASDLFAVQDDILRQLFEVLPVKISEAERVRAARRYTRSLEAYELFHSGLRAMGARERLQNEVARGLYWRAVGIDPGFARAYAGIAMTHLQDYRQQWAEDGAGALRTALELAEAARKIDPQGAEALWVLAFAKAHARQHDEAFALLKTTLRLSPSFADAYFLTGLLHMETGRPRDALAWMQAAMRLVPNPGYIHYFGFGQAYFFIGDLERAQANLREALLRNPAHAEPHLYLAATFSRLGRAEDAAWHVKEVLMLRPRFRAGEWLERHPLVDAAQRSILLTELQRLGL